MVIYPEMFSIKPESEVAKGFKNLFNTVSEAGAKKTLLLPKGNYVFQSKNAEPRKIYITNTIGENEYKNGEEPNMRKVALDMRNINDLEIDGNGSRIIIDGKMTNMVIENCNNITVKNLTIDAVSPNVHKVTVTKASPFYINFEVDGGSKYIEENGNYYWVGPDYKLGFLDFRLSGGWMLTAKPENYNHLTRNGVHPFQGASSLKETAPGVFSVRFLVPKNYEKGQVFYFYPCKREEVGILINNSKNIKLQNVTQRFNYSLAVVAQNSENITVEGCDFSPGKEREADFCSLADFLQICMCRGKVAVKNCNFDAAGDDTVNVHGFYFKITESNKDKMTVKFCHPQSYGFECIRSGDIISFVDPKTLLTVGRTKVLEATLRDEYYYDLVLMTYDPPVGVGGFIENYSANPDFEFSGNTVNRIPTRGMLVTTAGKVVIENNRFLNTGMSGIYISGDASSWFESGAVTDVTIRGNAFMNCDDNAVLIAPEIKKYGGAVHKSFLIENNFFLLNNTHAVNALACESIVLKNNIYKGKAKYNKPVITKNVNNLVSDT